MIFVTFFVAYAIIFSNKGDTAMTFGERLKKMRTEQGFTQDELAEKLYVTRTAISKWETDRGFPNIDSLKQIAELFNISVDELLEEEEKQNQRQQEEKVSKRLSWITAASCGCLVLVLILSAFIDSWYITAVLRLSLMAIFVFATFEKHDIQGMDKKKFIIQIVIKIIIFVVVFGITIPVSIFL